MKVVAIGTAGISAMVAVAAYGQMDTSSNGPKAETVVDAAGNLRVPDDYRTTYQSLGSWAVAADQGQGSKELHIVYASRGTIAAFRRNGRFPDGAVLVKEVFETATGKMTTGTVSHAETLKGWFVLVRDTKGLHPGNRLWGDGWGWSWFDEPNPSKTTSTDYKADCLPCHQPARASDWIYVGGYPPLRQ
jgi:Cytochrome P460